MANKPANTIEALTKHIEALATKAENAPAPHEADAYTRAALNLANVVGIFAAIERDTWAAAPSELTLRPSAVNTDVDRG